MADTSTDAHTTSTLHLGFDASCGDCSRIASTIRQEAGERIDVISLHTPEMRRWREEALGEDAPWAPTLVLTEGDRVRAWTGWQIAPVLARHLDPRSTWRILGALGSNALSASPRLSGLGRRAVLRSAVGSVVGLGLLAKAGSSAAATPRLAGRTPSPDAKNVRELRGRALIDAAHRGLQTPDVANVADARSLAGRSTDLAGARAPRGLSRGLLRASNDGTGRAAPPSGELEVFGVRADRGGGVEETTILYYQHDQKTFLVLTTRNEPVDGVQVRAQRMHVDVDESGELKSLRTIASSLNGALPREIPKDASLEVLEADPCGGCRLSCGPGNPCGEEHLTDECNWEATWQCVAGAGGCALCVTCSGWFTCIACALTACPAAVDACCSSTNEVCARCVYPT